MYAEKDSLTSLDRGGEGTPLPKSLQGGIRMRHPLPSYYIISLQHDKYIMTSIAPTDSSYQENVTRLEWTSGGSPESRTDDGILSVNPVTICHRIPKKMLYSPHMQLQNLRGAQECSWEDNGMPLGDHVSWQCIRAGGSSTFVTAKWKGLDGVFRDTQIRLAPNERPMFKYSAWSAGHPSMTSEYSSQRQRPRVDDIPESVISLLDPTFCSETKTKQLLALQPEPGSLYRNPTQWKVVFSDDGAQSLEVGFQAPNNAVDCLAAERSERKRSERKQSGAGDDGSGVDETSARSVACWPGRR